MGWVTVLLVSLAIGAWWTICAARSQVARRHDKLESAFFRARGQRMVANGIRQFR